MGQRKKGVRQERGAGGMKYFMTQSLLSSWMYMFDCWEENADEAEESFLRVLNRVPTETTEAMQRGINFENAVYSCCEAPEGEYEPTARKIADTVRGGLWQVKAYKDKNIGGYDFLLYARCDVVKAGRIIDIKRVENYEVGKYLSSPQHPMYFECVDGAIGFDYLISDGNDVYTETYTPEITQSIDNIVLQFIGYLKAAGLWNIYEEKWKA